MDTKGRPFIYRWLLLLGICLLAACSSNTQIESDLGIDDAPDWVNEGTQAVSDNEGRLIQGVGMAPPMGDMALQQTTADNRARAEIAKVLSTYIDSTLDEYSSSEGTDTRSSIKHQLRSSTRMALTGTRILGHWKHEESGNIYAFAELDLDQVEKSLTTATSLNEGFRHYFSTYAGSHFDRFAQEGPR